MPDTDEEHQANMASVSIKIPEFYTNKPRQWFGYAESQFVTRNITQSITKFHHIIARLPSHVADHVEDMMIEVPTNQPYEMLKARLLEVYAMSNFQRAETLFNTPDLGDMKPSTLLTNMTALLPAGEKPGFLFHYLYMKKLPEDMRVLLAEFKAEDIKLLAAKADVIAEQRARKQVYEVREQFQQDLEQEVHAVNQRQQRQQGTYKLCHFHKKFGKEAYRCQAPCSWKPAGNAHGGNR